MNCADWDAGWIALDCSTTLALGRFGCMFWIEIQHSFSPTGRGASPDFGVMK